MSLSIKSVRIKPKIVTNGLILNLDAGSNISYPGYGTQWFDLSGNNYHANLMNGTIFDSSYRGIFILDGINDFITIPVAINKTMNTISIWLNMMSGREQNVMKHGSDNFSSFSSDWDMSIYPANIHGFTERPGGFPVSNIPSSFNVEIGAWKNFVLVRNDGGDVKIYKNGILIGTKVGLGHIVHNTTRRVYISAAGARSVMHVSQVSIYDRALSQQEIQQNYNVYKIRYGL